MRDNSNRPTDSCQDAIKIRSFSSDELIETYIECFSEYPPSVKLLLNFYLSFYRSGQDVYASNKYISMVLGISVRTIRRAKEILIDAGFITSEQRKAYSTCDIFISPFFENSYVRSCLSYFLPVLKSVSLSLLLSSPLYAHLQPLQHKNDRLLEEKDISKENYISSSVTNVQKRDDLSVGGIATGLIQKLCQKKDKNVERELSAAEKNKAMLEQEVFKITEVQLSKWGQIRFCAFPASIISKARLSFDTSLKGQPAFNSLFMAALTHCRKDNIEPDWKRVQYLADHFRQPDNAPMVLNSSPLKVLQDDTQIIRAITSTPRPNKTYSTSKYKPAERVHNRPEYLAYKQPESEHRADELVYVSYFTVEDGYKTSGNPLGFPNPYKEKYETYLNEALSCTGVPRETMEAELYQVYLQQKG